MNRMVWQIMTISGMFLNQGRLWAGDNWIGHVPAAWAAPTSSEDDQIFAPRHETVSADREREREIYIYIYIYGL